MSGKRDLNPRPSPWQGADRLRKFGNLAISWRAGRAIRAWRAIRARKNASKVHQGGLMHVRARGCSRRSKCCAEPYAAGPSFSLGTEFWQTTPLWFPLVGRESTPVGDIDATWRRGLPALWPPRIDPKVYYSRLLLGNRAILRVIARNLLQSVPRGPRPRYGARRCSNSR